MRPWPLLVAVAGAVVYLNALGNGFALDDIRLVRDDPRVFELTGTAGIFLGPYWYGAPEAGLYRPLTTLSLAANRALLGPSPWGFHLVNVLLHAAVCALAWLAARNAGTRYGTAFLTAIFFALHPIHVEAVANVAGRAELMAAGFFLAAWCAHRRALAGEGVHRVWGGAAVLAYLLAVLSKENAVGAPLVFLLDDALRGRRLSKSIFLYLGYAGALVSDVALRGIALGGLHGAETEAFLDNPAAGIASTRVATASWVLARYLGLMVWPGTLVSDYSFDAIPVVESIGDVRLFVGAGAIALLLALLVLGWRRSRPLALGIGVLLVAFLPTSNLFFPAGTIMAERLAYLPSLGACLIAGHLLATLAAGDAARRTLAIVVCVAVSLAFAVRTWTRTPVWKDNASLALHDVEIAPRSAKLQAGAAMVLHEQGRIPEAERRYRLALEIYPEYAQMHYNLAVLLAERGDDADAIEHAVRAGAISHANPRPRELAAALFESATRDGNPVVRLVYGRALFDEGLVAEAREVLRALATGDVPRDIRDLAGACLAEIEGDGARAAATYREVLDRPSLPSSLRSRVERWLSAQLLASQAGSSSMRLRRGASAAR